jgi:dTDP-glucose 4,6-dehydratase
MAGVQSASSLRWTKQPAVVTGDIMDSAGINEVMTEYCPDVVIHLAALTGIKRCEENAPLAFSINVLGTYNVLMGCLACHSKLVFMSSREVYGETRTSSPTREDDPLVPNNVYGITKMLAERLVLWGGSKHNLSYTILRLTSVYGPGGDQYNVQGMIRSALMEGKIQVLGGSQQLNLVYVKDVAETVRRALSDRRSSKEILNVGSKETLPLDHIVQKLLPLLSPQPMVERALMRRGETLRFTPSLDKLEETLQYLPPTTLHQGLQETVMWYRMNCKARSDSKPC